MREERAFGKYSKEKERLSVCKSSIQRPVGWEENVGIKGPEWKDQDLGTAMGKLLGLGLGFLRPLYTHNLILLKMFFYNPGDMSS